MQNDPSTAPTEKEQHRYPEFKIQSKLSLTIPQRKTEAQYDVQVSVLPLQSVKLRHGRGRGRQTPDQRYIPQSNSSPRGSIILQAKQLMFLKDGRGASEERKARLEQTLILERERRFIRMDIEKKNQRLVSPHFKQRPPKKFQRTEEKRLTTENKKFQRIKQKPNEHDAIARDRIMKKLILDPKNYALSGIAERSEVNFGSELYTDQSRLGWALQQTVSETIEESQIIVERKEVDKS